LKYIYIITNNEIDTHMDKEFEYNQSKLLQSNFKCHIIYNNDIPYTLYNANDIANIIELKSIRSMLRTFDISSIHKIKSKTNGGNQIQNYITYNSLIKLLCKSRRSITKNICEILNIDVHEHHFSCIENDVIDNIIKAFTTELIHKQYRINKYIVDLYFKDYNIIVECDELQHSAPLNIIKDKQREREIEDIIGECVFIRFNPYDKNFNIFDIINKIYLEIKNINKV